ncbi:MAG: hypothetical protein F6K39_40730, partial [Okeania sp. SIO3B3]|nr:hypothetical protein [Okeania sp. SIO3B3]
LDKALSYLATRQNLTLSELLEKAPTNEGIYRSHLQELLSILDLYQGHHHQSYKLGHYTLHLNK